MTLSDLVGPSVTVMYVHDINENPTQRYIGTTTCNLYIINMTTNQLTKTTSNYRTDRNECPEGPFNTTFYIATQRRLTTTLYDGPTKTDSLLLATSSTMEPEPIGKDLQSGQI